MTISAYMPNVCNSLHGECEKCEFALQTANDHTSINHNHARMNFQGRK